MFLWFDSVLGCGIGVICWMSEAVVHAVGQNLYSLKLFEIQDCFYAKKLFTVHGSFLQILLFCFTKYNSGNQLFIKYLCH